MSSGVVIPDVSPEDLYETSEKLSDEEIVSTIGPAEPAKLYEPPAAPVVPEPVNEIDYLRPRGKEIRVEGCVLWAQVFVLLAAVACAGFGISGIIANKGRGAGFPLGWTAFTVLAPMGMKVLGDFLVAVFRTYERLTEIRDALERKEDA